MTRAEATAVAVPAARRALSIERALGVALFACGMVFGVALAHAGARPWRYVLALAAMGMCAAWGALATSLWTPPPPAQPKPVSRWSKAVERRGFTVLVLVLAGIAVWSWLGTPGPRHWPSLAWLVPPRWLVIAAIGIAAAALSFRIPAGETLPLRLGAFGIGLALIAFVVSASGVARAAAFSGIWFLLAAGIRRSSRSLAAMEGAFYGGAAAMALLDAFRDLGAPT
jgi:hypothetical protein